MLSLQISYGSSGPADRGIMPGKKESVFSPLTAIPDLLARAPFRQGGQQ
jgi:hypothetical protein